MVETENLTTLLVTIPKFSAQDWLDSYETLAQFVGYDNMQSFIEAIVPNSILEKEQLDIRDSVSEHKALEILHEIAYS